MFLVDRTDGTIACQETDRGRQQRGDRLRLDSNAATNFEDDFEGAVEAELPTGLAISSAQGSIVR